MSKFAGYFAIEKQIIHQGFDVSRHDLIGQFTNGKKVGLSELTPFEYQELLGWLNRSFGTSDKKESERKDKMRKKIIAILCKMGYKTPDGRIDMLRINEWAVKYGKSHKQFNAYSYLELTELVTQAELMYNKFLSAL